MSQPLLFHSRRFQSWEKDAMCLHLTKKSVHSAQKYHSVCHEEDQSICLRRVGTPVVVCKDWRIWQEKLSPAERFMESSDWRAEGRGIDLDGGTWRRVARDQRAQWRCGSLSCGPHGTSRAVWDGQGEHPCVTGTLQHGLVSGRGGTSRGTMSGDHERSVATGGALTKRASWP